MVVRVSKLSREWLDAAGRFRFGKHSGRMADEVIRFDPSYIEWIVSDVEDCSEEDREVLAVLLERR